MRLLGRDDGDGVLRLVAQDGRLVNESCEVVCCEGGTDLPDWVRPNDPNWGGPGGPRPPSNPMGTPRCCTGNTICSGNDDEPLLIGMRLTGTIANVYTYGTGPNAGVPFNYSEDFDEIFTQQSGTSSCDVEISGSFDVPVPYRERNGASDVTRDIRVQATGVRWNRERGFFGDNADTGNDPITDTVSGIRYVIGATNPIRGTNANGYSLAWNLCRSASPLLPLVSRPDIYALTQPIATVLESGTKGASTPQLACLNRVVAEFSDSFNVVAGSDTNDISITARIYAFVAFLAPCEGI